MNASISIVVPTYARIESKKRLFKSILDQDISPCEVIVVEKEFNWNIIAEMYIKPYAETLR
ncbi:glycosyltransferase family 2 protein [Infirmifilum sp.]|uniref:glycosyltransferase family 2 protein n=1 Tax=Infirmifilum sp. TaxID=2856575 RepID=UPI003D12EE1B